MSNLHPIFEEIVKPYTVSKCYQCPTLGTDGCMLDNTCIHYDMANIDAEVERRRVAKVERLKAKLKGANE